MDALTVPVLSVITWSPFVGALLIMFTARRHPLAVRLIAAATTGVSAVLALWIYVGYDRKRGEGRIFKYDITGGRYEESDYHAIGSGGKDARNVMREYFRKDLSEEDALSVALRALYTAADEDVGTGGPDFVRGIYPTAKLVTASGIMDVEESRVRSLYATLLDTKKRGA